MTARALIIALDGADCDLVERWMAAGALPHLAALRSGGLTGALRTPEGCGDEAFWSAFHSGRTLGESGRYFGLQLRADRRKLAYARDRPEALPPVWQGLSAAGRRVAIIDLPKCNVAPALNGIHLCDWLVHGREYLTPTSWPAGLATEVVARFGAAPASRCSVLAREDQSEQAGPLRESLLRSAAMKGAAARHYLASEAWDLLAVGFKEAHCVSHALWHLIDARHESHVAGEDERLGRPLLAVYQALDREVGQLAEAAGPEASILLFTSLRMAPNRSGNHLMKTLAAAVNRAHCRPLDRLRQALSSLRHAGRPRHETRDRRWRSELCRALPHNEVSGALRLNVAGRDPGGRLAPGASHRRHCAALAEELRRLTHADSGAPAVAQVIETAVSFAGPRQEELPDLLVVWDRSRPIVALRSPRYGRIERGPGPRRRSGNHAAGGLYLVSGPAARRWGEADETAVEDLFARFGRAAAVEAVVPPPPSAARGV